MLPIEEPDLRPLANLHVGDVVWLIAVIMKVKPIATLVVPLEVKGWFRRFCRHHDLIHFKDGLSDSYQMRLSVCVNEETAKLRKFLKSSKIKGGSLFANFRKKTMVANEKKIVEEFLKMINHLEGEMYGYPECCVEFHAGKGTSSRARTYEEFLESGTDQYVPMEFWAVAHAPCSSTCRETLALGRKYLDAVAEFSESLGNYVESRLLLPRFYQTGGARFIDLQPLDYNKYREELAISKEQIEKEALSHLPEPIEIVLCEVPRPYVLVDAPEEPPSKTYFPNPDMIGTMWLAYTPGFGVYMVNAKTGKLALYIISDKWIPKVGEEWRSKSNFRIYRSTKTTDTPRAQKEK